MVAVNGGERLERLLSNFQSVASSKMHVNKEKFHDDLKLKVD
jgi:hypothetical protein